MKGSKLGALLLLLSALLAVLTTRTQAEEAHFLEGDSGYTTSFYLIGGHYQLYVYARKPPYRKRGYIPEETYYCLFNGNFQRVWPDHDAMKFGGGPIETVIPYKLGPTSLELPPGLYHVYVGSRTTCDWHFTLVSTNENTAGIAPVVMLKRTPGGDLAETASLGDSVQFYAQYRTEHDEPALVSGTLQIIHDGQVTRTAPLSRLKRGRESSAVTADVQWEPSDTRYLGKNTVRFIVKIGSRQFTSTGEFTLTR